MALAGGASDLADGGGGWEFFELQLAGRRLRQGHVVDSSPCSQEMDDKLDVFHSPAVTNNPARAPPTDTY